MSTIFLLTLENIKYDKEFLYKEESFAVIGAAMEVHRTLGWGFLENVYQTALAHEFALRDIPFAQQVRLPIYYKDVFAGEYIADFVVYEKLIVEIKSINGMTRVIKPKR